VTTTEPDSNATHSIDRDHLPLDLMGKAVFGLIIAYLVMNRAIPDLMVIPIGISIRPYEVVLLVTTGVWILWMIADPHPFPRGVVGLSGVLLVSVLLVAPFLNALNVSKFQFDAAERGLYRVVIFAGLFLASYHLAYRLKYGRRLIGVVIGITVVQATLGVFEFVTQRPLTFMYDLAQSFGLVFDPNAIRSEVTTVFTRLTGEIRATGTAPHPIVLSALIALGILVAGIWLVYAEKRRDRVWLGLALAVLVIAMPVPNSRTGFVIVGLAAIPLLVLMIKELPRIIPLILVLSMFMGLAFVISPETPRLLLNSVTRSDEDQNTQIRIERFSRVPELLESRPVVGAGYLTHDTKNVQLFDNAFNMAIIEFGILGFVLAMWWLLAGLGRSWAGTVRARRDEVVLTIGGVAAVIALLAGGSTFDAWTFDQFLPTALVVLGVAVGRSDVILRRGSADGPATLAPGEEIFIELSAT